jgi:hypothetical protein
MIDVIIGKSRKKRDVEEIFPMKKKKNNNKKWIWMM